MALDPNTLEALAAIITAVGGLYGAGRHLVVQSRRKREEYRQGILKEAKEEAMLIKVSLEAKIDKVEADFKVKQELVDKDLTHMQETYNSEFKALGVKIQELRQDISSQHANLVALLTKLVDR